MLNLLPNDEYLQHPELIFGIAGPIGVDIDKITDAVTQELRNVEYQVEVVKLTTQMMAIATDISEPAGSGYYEQMMFKMDHASAVCRNFKDPSALAKIGLWTINHGRNLKYKGAIPERNAYIIRQLKRPEEVSILRKIYGRQFILISAYGSEEDRKASLYNKLKMTLPTTTTPSIIAQKVEELISKDASEGQDSYGQQLRDTFHLADVFIDGMNPEIMRKGLHRFVQALFGRVDISPTKPEYGMYTAKSASLRSADLSRQVGAAIFDSDGDIVASGCNEVPKAKGGTYWDDEASDFRDVKLEHDSNETMKKEILRDLVERMISNKLLSKKATSIGAPEDIVRELTKKSKNNTSQQGPLVEAYIMDLTEYSRVVHAEMCAICDAARTGRSVRNCTIYVTTFPCHNCAKHIIASGITKVIFIEPYPKSKAQELFKNEISIEKEDVNKVNFLPFLGISPYRYRDIFQKIRRKDSNGRAHKWYGGICRPLIDVVRPTYNEAEALAALELSNTIKRAEKKTEPEVRPVNRPPKKSPLRPIPKSRR